MLSLRDVKVWFPIRRGLLNRIVGHVRAVDGVSLEVASGETLALVGESGCGKTTVGRAILGLTPVTDGEILFHGKSCLGLRGTALRDFRRKCQMVFQDPFSSLNPRLTVIDILTEAMVYHGLISRRERRSAAVSVLQEVGLGEDCLDRFPHEFSGGQRQRICIARALSLEPEFIVLDEPLSALDVSVQAQVMNYLMDLREARHLSYLFISHDISVVRILSQRVAVMYLGHIVETGRTEDVLSHPRHPYTQALLSAVPKVGKDLGERVVLQGEPPSPANMPSGCPFHPRCPFATSQCKEAQPPMKKGCACWHTQGNI